MKFVFLSAFVLLSSAACADESRELWNFTQRFLKDFPDHSKSAADVAGAHFAATPVFYIGQMPGFDTSPELGAKMVEIYREQFCVDSHPFTAFDIENQAVGADGSAAVLVAFRRPSAPDPRLKDFCNILSLAKLNGDWKIMTWFIYGLSARDCSHQNF
ncbi:hypothetical protein SAMN04487965_0195 [Microbulbifer donghaiensis]|uniref:SnoaL-like domain-containing protein n=1 Tax=Microbulbifer donghaiensis TaxID=494016 RepID=A0A1M4ULA9_9GAMM|nr:hypothetical protein [Microbulbifer donghaiensis]SHE57454.1 hypothetical protein SAMN04487965_0195 [Microbulbifer donghaiensis]